MAGGLYRVDPAPQVARPGVALLPATPGSQPAPRQVVHAAMMALVVSAWPIDKGPAFTQAQSNPKQIAPLTLVYGQQPPLASFVTTQEMALLRSSWDAPSLGPQPSARLVVGTAALAAYFGQPQSQAVQLGAWSGSPRLVTQASGAATIPAPLVVSSVPAPQPQTVALGSWQALVAPVRQSGIAAVLPAVVVQSVPFVRAPLVNAAWAPVWQTPPQPATTATLALPVVVQSVPTAPSHAIELAAWAQSWTVRPIPSIAATVPQPVVSPVLAPPVGWGLVLASWSPLVALPPMSPRLIQSADVPVPAVTLVPLSLPYALRFRR